MIFAFPYHDPEAKFNALFEKNFDNFEKNFDKVCISVTPPTAKNNVEFIKKLKKRGFKLIVNTDKSTVGDHYRNALKLGARYCQENERIFYGFLDRVIFDLETKWQSPFLKDLKRAENKDFLIFERSVPAWKTHPANYREIEQIVSHVFELLSGKNFELNPCAILINKNISEKILKESKSPGWETLGEWILLAISNKTTIRSKKVDWLAWEDPFWEKANPNSLKKLREQSKEETFKRIKSNTPFLSLLTEERFKHCF